MALFEEISESCFSSPLFSQGLFLRLGWSYSCLTEGMEILDSSLIRKQETLQKLSGVSG